MIMILKIIIINNIGNKDYALLRNKHRIAGTSTVAEVLD